MGCVDRGVYIPLAHTPLKWPLKRAVHILLECLLVVCSILITFPPVKRLWLNKNIIYVCRRIHRTSGGCIRGHFSHNISLSSGFLQWNVGVRWLVIISPQYIYWERIDKCNKTNTCIDNLPSKLSLIGTTWITQLKRSLIQQGNLK